MESKKPPQFGKRFLWGASTAAHQIEGNTHNQWTVWELENAKSLSAQARYKLDELESWPDIKPQATSTNNYVSGESTDHFNRYEEDFDLLKKLNMNAFRFSLEWSRIEPKEGVWDPGAIEHYKRYINELRRREIEPVMTLVHFTLPTWFTEKGGFEKRSNISYFVRFAEKAVSELGSQVKYIITINEPDTYAWQSYAEGNWPPQVTSPKKAVHVLLNQARAHNKAAKAIHGLNRRYKVSVAKNSAYYYAGDDAVLSRASAHVLQWLQDDFFLSRVKRHCDFLGINYYFSNRVYGYRVHNPDERLSDLGWDMQPANIEYCVERIYKKYKLPIMITENGLADMDDSDRKWWIASTITALSRAREEGVQLIGYLHWSLIDNFEWAYGKWPRFGLIGVDYKTKERTLRPSAVWFAGILKKLRQS